MPFTRDPLCQIQILAVFNILFKEIAAMLKISVKKYRKEIVQKAIKNHHDEQQQKGEKIDLGFVVENTGMILFCFLVKTRFLFSFFFFF
mgnify:CR=1 FL=1